MLDDEKYINNEEQLLYLQKRLDEEDTHALKALFAELDTLAIARTLESFPAKPAIFYGSTFQKSSSAKYWPKSMKTSGLTTSKTYRPAMWSRSSRAWTPRK